MPILSWLTREQDVKAADSVPYRLLERDDALSHGDLDSGNMLIQGDNLEALKALLPYYRGQVKCIYIDPPYNTRSAFEHYDDNLEHSRWLAMMWPRLELLRELLAEDGSIWVSIDDNEGHYLKVIMDEVFGRGNFVANVVWEKSDSPKMDSRLFSSRHDHLLVYASDIESFELYRQLDEVPAHYNKKDEEGRAYYTKPLRAMGSGDDTREARPTMYFPLTAPDGEKVYPKRKDGSDGRWRWGPDKCEAEASRIEWTKGKDGWTPYFRIFADNRTARPPETIFSHQFAGTNRTSKIEVNALFSDVTFTTPKPERLMMRILELASLEGDLVLDSFLGSGTTAAVAHKLRRRWIGVEMGNQAHSHCVPRLKKVIDGEKGGISEAVEWKGGGGFAFYRLGAEVFAPDGTIAPGIKFAPLAAHIWFAETGMPMADEATTPFLGAHDGIGIALLYNGILGDKSVAGGNVLTRTTLGIIRDAAEGFDGPLVVYGEASRIGPEALKREGITFKQTPYDVKAR